MKPSQQSQEVNLHHINHQHSRQPQPYSQKDRWYSNVPPHLAQPCYVALGRALTRGLNDTGWSILLGSYTPITQIFIILFYFYHCILNLELHVQVWWCGGLPSLMTGSAPAIIYTLCCRLWQGISYRCLCRIVWVGFLWVGFFLGTF